jgi:hypothetical protein
MLREAEKTLEDSENVCSLEMSEQIKSFNSADVDDLGVIILKLPV